ncbi:MAG: sulfatase [Verrucomicrobiota bacterium]
MRFSLVTLSILILLQSGFAAEDSATSPPNFVVIIIDDLNDYVGCLGGHPNASTPNIDRLAERGVLFTNAHCNSPVCNPSRTSFLTGLRPATTGITSNRFGWFREVDGFEDVLTLPQAFADEGFATFGYGKTFHRKKTADLASPYAHSLRYPEWQHWSSFDYGPVLNQEEHLSYETGDRLTDWGIPPKSPAHPRASHDFTIAQRSINVLLDDHDKPFLVACGFYRPHTPLYAEEKWFELHPRDEIALPETRDDDRNDLVYLMKHGHQRTDAEIEAPGLWTHPWVTENDKWHEILQAYLASTSAMDAQVGRVLNALDRSPHRDNTYIVLFSDHGWHLGEKEHWGKAAIWEQTTRVPLIVAGPGISGGAVCSRPVELLSIYPTLIDLAGLPRPPHLEGVSLRPLLENPDGPWDHAALTTFCDHHSLRTDSHRYIRYADGSEELYDHTKDRHEFDNLAVTAAEAPGTRKLLEKLRATMDAIVDSDSP